MRQLRATYIIFTTWIIFARIIQANPLKRLFMMKPKSNDRSGPQQNCLAPDALEAANTRILEAESDRDRAINERDEARNELEKVKNDLLKELKDAEDRVAILSQASDSTRQIAAVQENFANQIAQMHTQNQKDLAETRDHLVKKEKELDDLKKSFERQLTDYRTTSENKLKDGEEKCRLTMLEASENATAQLHQAEKSYNEALASMRAEFSTSVAKIEALQNEKAMLVGEKQTLQQMHQNLESKYEATLKATTDEHRAKLRDLQKENMSLVGEKKVLQNMYDKMEQKYESVLKNWDGEREAYLKTHLDAEVSKRVEDVDALWNDKHTALKQAHELELQQIRNETDETIELIRNTSLELTTKAIEELKREHNETVSKLEEQLGELGAAFETSRDHLVEMQDNAKKSMKQLSHDKDATLNKTISELEAAHSGQLTELRGQITELESVLDKERENATRSISHLELQLEAAKLENLAVSSSALSERARLEEQIAELERLVREKEDTLRETRDTVSEVESQKRSLNFEVERLKKTIDQAMQESTHWETLFRQRSYLNMTHIGEDTLAYLELRKEAVSAKIREMQRNLFMYWNKLMENVEVRRKEFQQRAVPYLKLLSSFYDANLKSTVESIRVQYTKHVGPFVNTSRLILLQWFDEVRDLVKPYYVMHVQPIFERPYEVAMDSSAKVEGMLTRGFGFLVLHLRDACPEVISSLKSMKRQTGLAFPEGMVRQVEIACRRPRDTCAALLQGFAIFFALIFLRRIVRLSFGILRLLVRGFILVLRALWFLFPLRLLFRRKKTPSRSPTANGAPNGVAHSKHRAHTKKKINKGTA